ncbi:uncharacterized protein PV09_08465 [Verruconis gallopava]|uniref:Uncharacterized protein n=1 Tax=Verruconis gallopava TaxID=253628 RepID=A0A0D2ALJ3_9PEZI|nr:uncharacterized protein PV09_08465 [Verruconis gallopava]KIV99948.1 hypothetical protein PV09_08465 [Verruconis gallopava]
MMAGTENVTHVRRNDLRSKSPKPDVKLQQLFLDRVPVTYEYTDIAQPREDTKSEDGGQKEVEELEFRLFASTTESQMPVIRIRLHSPACKEESANLARGRPKSYYFKGQPSVKEQAQLNSVALSGEQVIEMSKMPCPGLNLPCRVIKLQTLSTSHATDALSKDTDGIKTWQGEISTVFDKKRRKRPGKKSRVAVRKKLQKEAERVRLARIAEIDKELAERMKKSKKNRDKKLRQRAKEKERKAAARAQQTSGKDNGDVND